MFDPSWPSTVIAAVLIVSVAAIIIAAIRKYPVNQSPHVWTLLGTLVGLIVGTMATYFFTQPTIRGLQETVTSLQGTVQKFQELIIKLGPNL